MHINFIEDHRGLIVVMVHNVEGSSKPLFAMMQTEDGRASAAEINSVFKELQQYVTFTATKIEK